MDSPTQGPIARGGFPGLVAIARAKHPVPSRTRTLSAVAPMVLRLKTWESRSPPNLKNPLNLSKTIPNNTAGWSSQVARQAHNLKVVGSNPTPATKILRVIRCLNAALRGGVCVCANRGSTVEARGCEVLRADARPVAAADHRGRSPKRSFKHYAAKYRFQPLCGLRRVTFLANATFKTQGGKRTNAIAVLHPQHPWIAACTNLPVHLVVRSVEPLAPVGSQVGKLGCGLRLQVKAQRAVCNARNVAVPPALDKIGGSTRNRPRFDQFR